MGRKLLNLSMTGDCSNLLMELGFSALSWLCSFNQNLLNTYYELGASLVAQTVKNLPAIGETQVQSLGQEDP